MLYEDEDSEEMNLQELEKILVEEDSPMRVLSEFRDAVDDIINDPRLKVPSESPDSEETQTPQPKWIGSREALTILGIVLDEGAIDEGTTFGYVVAYSEDPPGLS